MKRVAPSAHMSAAILPSSPINTSGARGGRGSDKERSEEEKEEREGGKRGRKEREEREGGKRGREGSKYYKCCVYLVLSPRYSGVLLHISAVSRLPRKHPNPPSESLTCLPSVASSRFSVYEGGETTD